MRLYLLPLFPIWIFVVFLIGKAFIQFTDDHGHRWWGGFPLWMAGGCGVLAPALIGGLFAIAGIIWP
jgi:hypothetical protein